MTDLEKLELSEKDFDLIVAGLTNLPNKDLAGEVMGDFLTMMLSKDDETLKEKLKAERQSKMLKAAKDKALLLEDIQILQGKILMLKRYLMQEGALKETCNIINHVK